MENSLTSSLENKKKNNSIEFFRFFFMLILAIWHFELINIFEHGYFVVEFFFILSGFLLYQSFLKKNMGAIQYTLKKIKRFYLEYLIAFALIYSLNLYYMRFSFGSLSIEYIFDNIVRIIPELLFLQDMGIFEGGFNYPLWYLSVLIVGGGLLYGMLNASKRVTINIILPVLIILVYTYLFSLDKSSLENWDIIGCFPLPLLRGMADISVGILICHIYINNINSITKYRTLLNLISIPCFFLFILSMFAVQSYDQYILIFVPVMILSCVVPGTWINLVFSSSFWTKCGSISFEMYLLHASVIYLYTSCVKYGLIHDEVLVFICYLTTLIIGSIVLKYIHDKVVKRGIPFFT